MNRSHVFFSFLEEKTDEVGEKWDATHFARPCQLFWKNSDKVYGIRRIREHLVDYEHSEIIYLVIRDQTGKVIRALVFVGALTVTVPAHSYDRNRKSERCELANE